MKIAVLGAGAAGLAAARALQRGGAEVLLFEGEARAGGKIHTHCESGLRCEDGPNALASGSTTALRLAEELSLEIVEARPPRTRFVVRRGAMHPAPSFGLLSLGGWARALAEPFWSLRKPLPGQEESLSAFLKRHFGAEAGGLGARLMAAGVYAGDPERLAVREAFGKISALEDRGGSLMLGALRRPRTAPSGPRSLWSLAEGLGALPRAMAQQLGGALRLSTRVERLERTGGGYRLRLAGAGAGEVEVEGVISALPPRPAAALLGPLAPALAKLAEIRCSPIAVVHLVFRASDLTRIPQGFGVLDGDGSTALLGTLFPSALFAGRAPESDVLLTALLGGLGRPEAVTLSDGALVADCRETFGRLFGATAAPVYQRVVRWSEAVPQPELGHASRVAAAREATRGLPPLELAGAAFGGASVEQVLAGGEAAAERLRARLIRREA